jgi:opacity protein-like surface antigen
MQRATTRTPLGLAEVPMRLVTTILSLVLLGSAALAGPASTAGPAAAAGAEQPEQDSPSRSSTSTTRPTWQGWGVRVGVAGDPDQVLGGIQLDLGEIIDDLYLRPDVELGVGDDHLVLSLTAPVHYHFHPDVDFTPYAGGGLSLSLVDVDKRGNDDTDVELALEIVGGLQWSLERGRAFSVELNVVFGDPHDFEVLAGWSF